MGCKGGGVGREGGGVEGVVSLTWTRELSAPGERYGIAGGLMNLGSDF